MPLHIFEPRYQNLVSDCLSSESGFGLMYHDWDDSGPFMSEEGRVGCVAEIRAHKALEDGRSLIIVEGTDRFRINDGLESEALYFEALVTPDPDASTLADHQLVERRRESIDLFDRVLATLSEPPEDPPHFAPEKEASFPLAQTIQIEPEWHQHLLELRDENVRLTLIDRVFRAVLE